MLSLHQNDPQNGDGFCVKIQIILGALRAILLAASALCLHRHPLKALLPILEPSSESERLIDGSQGFQYGAADVERSHQKDAQLSGWLDYFVGFGALFPFFWYAWPTSLIDCSTEVTGGRQTRRSSSCSHLSALCY